MFGYNSFMQLESHLRALFYLLVVSYLFSTCGSDPHFLFGDREMSLRPYASSLNRANLVLQQLKVS